MFCYALLYVSPKTLVKAYFSCFRRSHSSPFFFLLGSISLHAAGWNSRSSGNNSSLPASISNISYIHPKSIRKIKFEGKPVEHEVVRATNVYFITFVLLFALSMLIVSFEGRDMLTNFTAVAATINNIGPGLELVGPTQNFGFFSPLTKWVLMFDMLAGRLELFPLLLLFHPAAWSSDEYKNEFPSSQS